MLGYLEQDIGGFTTALWLTLRYPGQLGAERSLAEDNEIKLDVHSLPSPGLRTLILYAADQNN